MDTANHFKKTTRTVILALALVVLPIHWSKSASATAPETYMTEVRRTGNWQRIKATATQLLEQNPGNQYCLMNLVEANIQLKHYDEARAALIRLRKEHGSPQPYLWALLEYTVGNYKEADKHAEAMLAAGTRNRIELNLSENIAHKLDRRRWIQLFAKHHKLEHASWYLSAGVAGDHDIASQEVTAMVKAHKAIPHELNQFIVALISQVPMTKLTPDEKILVATAYAALGNEDAALNWCDSVATTKPKETIAVLNLLAGFRFNSHAKARRLFEKLEPVCGKEEEYWYLRSVQSWQERRPDDALKYSERSIALSPTEKALWLRFAIDLEEASARKKIDARSRLLSDLQPLVQKYPSVRSYKERAKVLHELDRLEEEASDLAHLVELLPPGPEKQKVRLRKAEVEYTLGDLRAAKKTTELALQTQDNARARILMEKIEKEMRRASMKF